MARNTSRAEILEGQTIWLTARPLGPDGAVLLRANIDSGELKVYDPKSATPDTPVDTVTLGFSGNPGTGTNCMWTALVTDGYWSVDNIGYSFQFGFTPADFPMAGSKTYRIEVELETTDFHLLPMVWFIKVEERAG
mgnify:CR=1 FL=1